MATKKQPSKTTALANWDEELAKQAEVAAAVEANAGGGQFFSLAGGKLSFNDAPMKDNKMAVIILDTIFENTYYEGRYDPTIPQAPICYAFGRDEKVMEPHKLVVQASNQQCGASGQCAGCELNEWGSSDVGRGKACRNSRRLALIPAGNFNGHKFELIEDESHFEVASIAYMRLPVTSVKGYASFVKSAAGALKRPPHGIITKVEVVDDDKNQFRVIFEPIMTIPNELMGVIMKRHEEAKRLIDFPYPEYEEAPPAKKGRAQAPAAKKRKY